MSKIFLTNPSFFALSSNYNRAEIAAIVGEIYTKLLFFWAPSHFAINGFAASSTVFDTFWVLYFPSLNKWH